MRSDPLALGKPKLKVLQAADHKTECSARRVLKRIDALHFTEMKTAASNDHVNLAAAFVSQLERSGSAEQRKIHIHYSISVRLMVQYI